MTQVFTVDGRRYIAAVAGDECVGWLSRNLQRSDNITRLSGYGSFRRAWDMRRHLDLDNVVFDGVYNQIADGVQAELPHDVAPVRLNSLGAQVQERGHFLGTFSLCEKLSDLALSGGQRG